MGCIFYPTLFKMQTAAPTARIRGILKVLPNGTRFDVQDLR